MHDQLDSCTMRFMLYCSQSATLQSCLQLLTSQKHTRIQAKSQRRVSDHQCKTNHQDTGLEFVTTAMSNGNKSAHTEGKPGASQFEGVVAVS